MKRQVLVFTTALLLSATTRTMGGTIFFLDALGAEHAHSDGVAVTSVFFGWVPNVPGNAVFAGTTGLVVAPPGLAFGAGSGFAARPAPLRMVLGVNARAVIIPAGPGLLHAWGLGYADPTPDPFLDPFDDAALLGIFGDKGPVEHLRPGDPGAFEDETAFLDVLAMHPVTSATPGTDAAVNVTMEFDEINEQIDFGFDPMSQMLIEAKGVQTFSASIGLRSEALGIELAWVYDETGFRPDLSEGWVKNSLDVTSMRDRVLIDGFEQLSFTLHVPGFTPKDFQGTDLVLQTIVTAQIPEPASIALLTVGALVGRRRRRRRCLGLS